MFARVRTPTGKSVDLRCLNTKIPVKQCPPYLNTNIREDKYHFTKIHLFFRWAVPTLFTRVKKKYLFKQTFSCFKKHSKFLCITSHFNCCYQWIAFSKFWTDYVLGNGMFSFSTLLSMTILDLSMTKVIPNFAFEEEIYKTGFDSHQAIWERNCPHYPTSST